MPTNDTRCPHTDTCGHGNSLSEEAWEAIDKAVRQLETAWQVKAQPSIRPFVPPANDPLRQRVLVELIKVDQERRWNAGARQPIETYFDQWPELRDKPELVGELLEAECVLRAAFGAMPTREELQQRFPNLCEKIDLAGIEAEAAAECAPTRPTDILHTFRPFGEVEGYC